MNDVQVGDYVVHIASRAEGAVVPDVAVSQVDTVLRNERSPLKPDES